MGNDNLKKAEQIAKDTKAKLEKEAEVKANLSKKEAESKGAAEEVKTEGSKSILVDAEKQAENDARILSTKDEELSEEDKKRKSEIQKIKADKEAKENPEDKIKHIKEETQKRIDEVIGELKAAKSEREQDAELIKKLNAEIDSLKKTMQPKIEEDKDAKVRQFEQERISKYLEEDKNKPRDRKREMTKEELEEWLLEDLVEAQSWMTDRNIRRKAERDQITAMINDDSKEKAEEFITKQQKSLNKLISAYPSIIPSKERLSQLNGKSKDEIDKILRNENEDYNSMMEIIESNPKRYVESENGPELVLEEMNKRKKPGKKVVTLTEEELAQKIKDAAIAEAQRLAGIDEGLSSGGIKKMEKNDNKSPFRLKQEELARKAHIPIEKLDAAIKRRETINGASFATAEDFNKD